MRVFQKLTRKLRKEIRFIKIKKKHHCKTGKRLSLMGTQYFRFGDNIHIGDYYRLECYDTYEREHFTPSLSIGDRCYIGNFFTVLCASEISIGKDCLIASFVTVCDLNHGTDALSGLPFSKQNIAAKPISIGDNCWIGEKAIILPGVTIGDNVVIGAGSVVTKDIPSNCVAVGNPARVVRKQCHEQLFVSAQREN